MNLNDLVGPISSDYCALFSITAIFRLASLVIIFGLIIYNGIKTKQKMGYYVLSFLVCALILFAYLKNRLLYNMCEKSI
jgi:hypothetical protein